MSEPEGRLWKEDTEKARRLGLGVGGQAKGLVISSCGGWEGLLPSWPGVGASPIVLLLGLCL